MLEELQKLVVARKVDKTLKKYGIELKHYIPGRIRLAIPAWKEQETKLRSLLEEMKKDPDIVSVDFTEEIGTILILFNKDAIKNKETLHRWQAFIQKYM